MQEATGSVGATLSAWEPEKMLKHYDTNEVRFSKGYLRSKPEKWFPSFAAQWLPLAHSLGIELKLVEVKTLLKAPNNFTKAYFASLDDEPMAIACDQNSFSTLVESFVPSATPAAMSVVGEYLARRLLGSLLLSWSGPESSVVNFDSNKTINQQSIAGAVKISFLVNSKLCVIWLLVGRMLLERLDNLWRKQVRSSTKSGETVHDLQIELVQLAVPPATLEDYLHPGAKVDLELSLGDQVVLRSKGKAYFAAKLGNISGNFALEILAQPPLTPSLPDGMTRLSVELGRLDVDAATIAELSQAGATIDSKIALSNKVSICVNNEVVATATLCCFEGRFAVRVDG